MATVVLIDAGGTNIGSVRYALQRLGVEAPLSSDADEIRAATHVILPGVGAAAPGMARLRASGLIDVVRGLTQPVLGVCLGMQLLFEHSQEGDTPCLGLIPARLHLFPADVGLRVPHMGWNRLRKRVDANGDTSPLLDGIDDGAHTYFVHSYAVLVDDDTDACVLAESDHGQRFAAVVGSGKHYGAQFHPERSSAAGLRLLDNFLKLPA